MAADPLAVSSIPQSGRSGGLPFTNMPAEGVSRPQTPPPSTGPFEARATPADGCTKWKFGDEPNGNRLKAVNEEFNLGTDEFRLYAAIGGKMTADNLPPPGHRLEDCHIGELIELREAGLIPESALTAYPDFTSTGYPHEGRKPTGRPYLCLKDEVWYIGQVGRVSLMGGAEFRYRYRNVGQEKTEQGWGRPQWPWVDSSVYSSTEEWEAAFKTKEAGTPAIVASDMEFDVTCIDWPTEIDSTRVPPQMKAMIAIAAEKHNRLSLKSATAELTRQDQAFPAQKAHHYSVRSGTAPKKESIVYDFNDEEMDPMIFSVDLFDGRLQTLDAEKLDAQKLDAQKLEAQKLKAAAAQDNTLATTVFPAALGPAESLTSLGQANTAPTAPVATPAVQQPAASSQDTSPDLTQMVVEDALRSIQELYRSERQLLESIRAEKKAKEVKQDLFDALSGMSADTLCRLKRPEGFSHATLENEDDLAEWKRLVGHEDQSGPDFGIDWLNSCLDQLVSRNRGDFVGHVPTGPIVPTTTAAARAATSKRGAETDNGNSSAARPHATREDSSEFMDDAGSSKKPRFNKD